MLRLMSIYLSVTYMALSFGPAWSREQQSIPDWARAIGRVRMDNNYGGSCTLFAVAGKKGYCLTNQHVVGSSTRGLVTFNADDKTYQTKVTWRIPGADAAILMIARPAGITPIPLAHLDEMPQPGEEVYLAGWGGSGEPRLTLWRGVARGFVAARASDISATGNLISGDSGGAQVYDSETLGLRLIGVNWGWTGPDQHADAVSAPYIIHQIHLLKGLTTGEFCSTGTCIQGRRPPPGTVDVPIPAPPIAPRSKPISNVDPKENVADLLKVVEELRRDVARLQKQPPAIRGTDGKNGEPGAKGAKGDRGADGDLFTVEEMSDDDIQLLADRLPGIPFVGAGGSSTIGFLGGKPVELKNTREE